MDPILFYSVSVSLVTTLILWTLGESEAGSSGMVKESTSILASVSSATSDGALAVLNIFFLVAALPAEELLLYSEFFL